MPTTETQPKLTTETTLSQPAPATESPWPRPDFEREFQRLRAELESAVRREKVIAEKIAGVQERAFRTSLPVSVLLGGKEEAQKLSDEQDAAQLVTQQARTALRKFLDDERGRFEELKREAHRCLQKEIAGNFARTQAAASELLTLLGEWLGAKDEIEAEENQIRDWNRAARNLNRLIPAENVIGVPVVRLIDSVASLRSTIAGMLLGDPDLRDLVRFFLARDADARQRVAAHSEFLEQQSRIGTIDDPSFDHRV